MQMAYRWTKVWAVNARADDKVKPGDLILVESKTDASEQRVVSVTEITGRHGATRKVLLVGSRSDGERTDDS